MSKVKKKKTIIPMGNCIFVLPDSVIDKTGGGIFLTDYTKKRPTSGTIVAFGSKVKDFRVGERVIYGEFAGAKHLMNIWGEDREVFLMTDNDILAKLE